MSILALRRIASLVTHCPNLGPRPFIALENVESGTGRLVSMELDEREVPDAGAAAVEPGFVLFGRLRPYLAKTWLADRPTYASTELLVLQPKDHIDSRWLAYLCSSRPMIEWAVATSDGTKMPRTNWDKLSALRVHVPTFVAQREIAHYLDVETARIDSLIEKQYRLLHLMAVRRSSAIAEALESADCGRVPLRRLVTAFIDYRGATPEKSPMGVPLITATNVSDGEIDFSLGQQFVSDETYVDWMQRGSPEVGDVLLTTEAPLGEVAMISDPRVALAQRIILLRPDRRRVVPEFLYTSLWSSVVQADLLSRASGSTVWGIRADRLRDVAVHVACLSEQRRVVGITREVQGQYRRARATLHQQIALLRERREALITAALTGELEVAEADVA